MPVIACKDCLPLGSFSKRIAGLFLLFIAGSCGTALHAQTIRIKLVDGRNGRAMAGTCVNVWVGKERKDAMAIPTDKEGVASLRLTDKDAETDTQNQWKECGLFGVIGPVVKYADSIGINVGYVLCQVRQADHTWLATQKFSTEEVLHSGVVTANTCGKAKASPTPGEIVLFVRPLSWWEKLKE
jgi:hypothetical protein